jgi:hypothetical protein
MQGYKVAEGERKVREPSLPPLDAVELNIVTIIKPLKIVADLNNIRIQSLPHREKSPLLSGMISECSLGKL